MSRLSVLEAAAWLRLAAALLPLLLFRPLPPEPAMMDRSVPWMQY